MDKDTVRSLISRTIEDVEALVNTEPGEIFLDVPAADPRYIRVEEGGTVREGDIGSRSEEELEAPSLRKWTIEEIGSKTVTGVDLDSGEQEEWDREAFERKLATGAYSAKLSDFERVNVIGGSSKTSGGEGGTERESVTVVVFGNDGRKFTRSYRRLDSDVEGDGVPLELTESGEQTAEFGDELQERFDNAVKHALRSEGYEP